MMRRVIQKARFRSGHARPKTQKKKSLDGHIPVSERRRSRPYSRGRSFPSAPSLCRRGDLPQSGAGASRLRAHPCTATTHAVMSTAYDAASETFAYRPTAHVTAVAHAVLAPVSYTHLTLPTILHV